MSSTTRRPGNENLLCGLKFGSQKYSLKRIKDDHSFVDWLYPQGKQDDHWLPWLHSTSLAIVSEKDFSGMFAPKKQPRIRLYKLLSSVYPPLERPQSHGHPSWCFVNHMALSPITRVSTWSRLANQSSPLQTIASQSEKVSESKLEQSKDICRTFLILRSLLFLWYHWLYR